MPRYRACWKMDFLQLKKLDNAFSKNCGEFPLQIFMLAPLHWHSKFPQFFCIHLGYAQCNIESPWNPYKYCTMKISEEDMRANTMYRAGHPFRWRSFAGAEGCQHWGPILCGTLLASGFSGKTPVGHHGLMAAFGVEVCHPSLASNTVRLLWLNWASCTEAVLMPKLSVTLRKQLQLDSSLDPQNQSHPSVRR